VLAPHGTAQKAALREAEPGREDTADAPRCCARHEASALGLHAPYAEVFELEHYDDGALDARSA
jgi:hypothetical protein